MAHVSHNLDEEKPVCICINGGSLTVSPDPVKVSIQAKHRVHWFLCGEGTIDSIQFKKHHPEPFHADHNVPVSRTHFLSDIVTDETHGGKTFKYTIVVTPKGGTQIALDPGVEVMPYPAGP